MAGHAWLHAARLVGRIVAIGPDAEKDEVTWEPGMHALLLSVEQESDKVWNAQLDFRPFMKTNHPLMKRHYYDENFYELMTAEEMGYWSDIDTWNMPPPGVAWATRILPGPVLRAPAPGFQLGKHGLPKLSMFASDDEANAWTHCKKRDMARVRALAYEQRFFGTTTTAHAA